MATEPRTTGLTYGDLQRMFPEVDNVRRELIDGDLIVAASPSTRHQQVVVRLLHLLLHHAEEHGGEVLPGPYDVKLSDRNVLEPDLLFVTAEHVDRFGERFIDSAPDLVVEVSSPSTRRREVGRKRELYESYGVAEYWFVDLDADRIVVHRLREGRYGPAEFLAGGQALTSPLLPGFDTPVEEFLRPRRPR